MVSARRFSSSLSASYGLKKRHCPFSSNSGGRSGAFGLKIGGSHFPGEKYEASGSWCAYDGVNAGGSVEGAKVCRMTRAQMPGNRPRRTA